MKTDFKYLFWYNYSSFPHQKREIEEAQFWAEWPLYILNSLLCVKHEMHFLSFPPHSAATPFIQYGYKLLAAISKNKKHLSKSPGNCV